VRRSSTDITGAHDRHFLAHGMNPFRRDAFAATSPVQNG
jgi:hypothetical protein